MNRLIDATHDPALRSWVESANAPDSDFPVQNLPLGRFRLAGADEPLRCGVAIGDQVLDLQLALQLSPWPDGVPELLAPLAAGELAAFMALGRPAWKALRAALSAALAEGSDTAPFLELCLLPQAQAAMALPCRVGDYTDFYTGIHHALTVGKLMRPDHPLLPNYKWVPIGYHGRASSVTLGGPVTRPRGQTRSSGDTPHFGPSQRLDYELELGLWVGVGNELGTPVPMAQAEERLFGVTLLNDWSARDLQGWEYQPLGPFLAKNFSTMVSPWIVSFEALAPFRRPFTRPAGDPQPLPYLDSEFNREAGALDIRLEVWLQTARMRELGLPAQRLSHSNALDAYWTPAQLVAHHTSNGCNLATGDLLGTGTLSGPLPAQGGSLLELSAGGRQPLALPGGETRCFLEDGDTVTLRAFCAAPGAVRIGLGSVSGTVLPA
ncbi:MAG: fumarylacetoacetase [Rubrivivax sp.]|nr:fumarylacetoacetase [Rubrivivax sp.]